MTSDHSAASLAGIHILDLSRVLAAPYATMALGDLGAEIIKIERPGLGDETRQWGPPFLEGQSAYFLSANRNKKSCEVDLGDPQGQLLVRTLALQWADVVVENFKPGTLEKFDLSLAALRAENARLITATLRGYPQGDDRPGYDFVMQAASGLMSLGGPEAGPPYKTGIAVADITSGLFLLSGILSALFVRERTGSGQHVEVSLFDSQVAWWANVGMAHLVTGNPPVRWGNAHPQLAPYELFEATDGYLAVAVGNDQQFANLCQVLQHPEWATDLRYRSNPERVNHRSALHEDLQSVLGQQTVAKWTQQLDAKQVPAGPVRTIPQALAWRNAMPNPVVSLLDGIPQIHFPWRFSDSSATPRYRPPELGEHTTEVWELYRSIRKDQ
jgi:crotonobetainyl-CoA:carnitine CoA-transferase CaiB-like acyl-CoA transferase